ncbi:hypothetical protein [Hymenobacter jeollabukensis]|uniref:Uncharacterized protein n=1 Tax=Hymenobacter jeollabukensis TaxID=2025313 RepID=A0A5R8WWE0_9BACT|nr:hypothetical protein [Hymenobacter jeollabukensis]TLM96847.1 hypothetical protein FDY95_02325 [Hymenobacter jeollabukensis]
MPLYTFFFDYRCTTFTSQVHAEKPEHAPSNWAEQQTSLLLKVPGIGRKTIVRLLSDLAEPENHPTAIPWLHNAYHLSVLIRGYTAFIDFVKTEEE